MSAGETSAERVARAIVEGQRRREAGKRYLHRLKLDRIAAEQNQEEDEMTEVVYDPDQWTMTGRHVDVYDRTRLVVRPGRTRRTRERIVLSHCEQGWLANIGFPGEETCSTVLDYARRGRGWHDEFHAFHDANHVTWRVERYQGASRYTSWWCTPHLPDEYLALIRK
jgi:hypothetical protein